MDDFEKYATRLQNTHYELLDGTEYDVLQRNQLQYLRKLLENCIHPDVAKKLAEKLTSNLHSHALYYRIVIITCNIDGVNISVPVLRVKEGNSDVFYDYSCRKYKSWEHFLSTNQIPKCTMIYPAEGRYEMKDGKLLLETKKPPRIVFSEVCKKLQVVAKVVSVIALTVSPLKVAKPYNNALIFASGISNGYNICYNGYKLYDRAVHDQSIGLFDTEASAVWVDIGESFLMFGVTCASLKFINLQDDTIIFMNLLNMVKLVGNEPSLSEGLQKLQRCILCHHLCLLEEKAVEFIYENITKAKSQLDISQLDIRKLINNAKCYVLNGSLTKKFRELVYVDEQGLRTVARDMQIAREIPRLFQTQLYDLCGKLNGVCEKIMEEVNRWANQNISEAQLIFRVSCVCQGGKKYETIQEMCDYFNVSQVEDVIINEKRIFEGEGEKLLEIAEEYDIKEFPQLLSYAVEYMSDKNENDLQRFPMYFTERVYREMSRDFGIHQGTAGRTEWINALTLDDLSYAQTVPANGIQLVKPKLTHGAEIRQDHIFHLAKRLMGRAGKVEVKLAREDVDWVMAASKSSRYVVIIAPKVNEVPSVSDCYPVFKKLILRADMS